jgi:hypothetical protein
MTKAELQAHASTTITDWVVWLQAFLTTLLTLLEGGTPNPPTDSNP